MTRTGPQKYPGADLSHWYQDTYGGDAEESNTGVVHTTEGNTLPSYGGGAEAPNFTLVPDLAVEKLKVYQHFGFDTSSRALVNAAGGVQTNTLNVVQFELVGTCDPTTHKNWNDKQIKHIYWPEAPDWALLEFAKVVRWAYDNHKVPMTSTVTWKAYPGSYGPKNGVRLTFAQWNAYSGWLGHQHVPENLHGDPGAFQMAKVLAYAKAKTWEKPVPDPTPAKEPTVATTQDLVNNLMTIGSLTEKDAKGKPVNHAAGYYLAHCHADLLSLHKKVDALTAAIAALAGKTA